MRRVIKKTKQLIKKIYANSTDKKESLQHSIQAISESKLFDFAYYNSQLITRFISADEAILHYLTKGVKLKLDPNPFFCTSYYLDTYSDVRRANFNPLLHFIFYGYKEGRNPSQKFNTSNYLKQNEDVKKAQLNPLFHYLNYGMQEGRDPLGGKSKNELSANQIDPDNIKLSDFDSIVIDIISNSGLFDKEYYLAQTPNHTKIKDALKHFIVVGTRQGLNPNQFFNTSYYLQNNKDVAENNINPLFHYIVYGVKEGRNPSPEFDTNYYLEINSDVQNAGINPLNHYLRYGHKEGRAISLELNKDPNTYIGWTRIFDTIRAEDIALMKKMIPKFKIQPLISVVTPVYNPEIIYLKKAFDSIINQTYENWELCLADDCSTDPNVKIVLDEYQKKDKRIKVCYREKNGHISDASNSAINLATGDYIALLDQDDELPAHALFMVVHALNENTEICLIYSDEDKIDINGNRHGAYFKSDWNYDLFCGHNMISHLGVYKTSIVKKIGGFRKGYEGSQDYDLAHRFIEQIKISQIKHIPHVLYHWRTLPSSTASSMGSKNYAYDAALRSLADHLKRTNQDAEVVTAPNFGYRVRRHLPTQLPLVSIIIPTKDKLEYLSKCIESIIDKTTYKNYEIIIIDNNSKNKSTLNYLVTITRKYNNIKVVPYAFDFNYSAINNLGVNVSKGEIIGLLNNDVEVINEDWLSEIVSQVLRKEVGAVGAKLYFSNNTIQHAGIILGIHTVGNHIHKNYERESPGYFNKTQLIQNFLALTGACLFVKKHLYEEVGGLNEIDLQVAYNDVDFCLKLKEKGYINVWTPFAELYHHESISRGTDFDKEENKRLKSEVKYMYDKWSYIINNDPYYSPNLSNQSVEFKLSIPPRKAYPWAGEKAVKKIKHEE